MSGQQLFCSFPSVMVTNLETISAHHLHKKSPSQHSFPSESYTPKPPSPPPLIKPFQQSPLPYPKKGPLQNVRNSNLLLRRRPARLLHRRRQPRRYRSSHPPTTYRNDKRVPHILNFSFQFICHCTDDRKLTSSMFATNFIIKDDVRSNPPSHHHHHHFL